MKNSLHHRIAMLLGMALRAFVGMRLNAAAADASNVSLKIGQVGPRELSSEDHTQKAIVRDYGKAWKSLNNALSANNPQLLGDVWVGVAKEKWLAQIKDQKTSGLTAKYIDRGHKL